MRNDALMMRCLATMMFLAILLTPTVGAQNFNCFPSCDEDDARFLVISGSNLVTLSDPVLELQISVPADATSFQLGVFDGDSGEVVPGTDAGRWDIGVAADYEYTLIADPMADGTGTVVIPLDPDTPIVASADMPNDAWCCSDIVAPGTLGTPGDFTILTTPDARTPSGTYFYTLRVELLNPALTTSQVFKVRSSGVITIELFAQPFSVISNIGSFEDAFTVYPELDIDDPAGTATPTTYDGSYSFFFEIESLEPTLTVWDGDFDRGKFDGTDADTDDPDTTPIVPPFATPDALPEGAAISSPDDDGDPAGFGVLFVRSPSLRYDLIAPDGQVYANDNPSGNQEWEAFTLSTAPFDPTAMDISVPSIPFGTWEMRIDGLDLGNLNAVFLPERAICVDQDGEPCQVRDPFLLGDTVFLDFDGDGVQDPEDPSIPFTRVELLNAAGSLAGIAITDPDANCVPEAGGNPEGNYCFEVRVGDYTVIVAADNFAPGGALEGMVSTTGGDQRFTTVVDANDLDNDFGYQPTVGGEGCTPGYWKQKHHFDAWVGYDPGDAFNDVFGVNAAGDPTLLQALKTGGGGFKALGRHAVAALLDAANSDVDYLYTEAAVIAIVRHAYATGDPETAKDLLEAQNEQGCPLN